MKKAIITIILALAATFGANAQVRVEAALDMSKIKFGARSVSYSTKYGLAPAARVFYQFNEAEDLGTEIGIAYMGRKTQSEKADISILGTNMADMTISAIEIPIHEFYNFHVSDAFTITPMLGLYFDYNVAGKVTAGGSVLQVTSDPFEGDNGLKRFDFGTDDEILFTIMDRFTLGVGYQHGFFNMLKSSDVDASFSNFYFAAGIKF